LILDTQGEIWYEKSLDKARIDSLDYAQNSEAILYTIAPVEYVSNFPVPQDLHKIIAMDIPTLTEREIVPPIQIGDIFNAYFTPDAEGYLVKDVQSQYYLFPFQQRSDEPEYALLQRHIDYGGFN